MAKASKTQEAEKPSNLVKIDQDRFAQHKGAMLRLINGEIANAKAALKAANKKLKLAFRDFEDDGGFIDEMKLHLKKHALEVESRGLGVKRAAISAQYDEWGGLKPGEQGSLIGALDKTLSDSDAWWQRGFDDIYDGFVDPEGHKDAAGNKSPFQCMVGHQPSYCPTENFNDWNAGAQAATDQIHQEYLTKQGVKGDTPVEKAAKDKAAKDTAAEFDSVDA